jgi:predicted murein hydrolase (TIGR00659 family)
MLQTFIIVIITILIYIAMKQLYKVLSSPFTVPILTSTISIVIILLLLNVDYDTYMSGAKWIDLLLGPAVVSLALPLYKQKELIATYKWPLFIGIISGSIVGISSGVLLSKWLSLPVETILSIAPKSVTTPVAMDISETIGGIAPLAAVYVMIAGISGSVFGPLLLKWFNIHHFVGKGIGLGGASHGIGTSRALEIGDKEGAVSSVAMTLSAISASLLAPFIVRLFL